MQQGQFDPHNSTHRYSRELFREAIPYSEINRMAEIVFLPRWQKLFVAAKRWKMATGNQVPW